MHSTEAKVRFDVVPAYQVPSGWMLIGKDVGPHGRQVLAVERSATGLRVVCSGSAHEVFDDAPYRDTGYQFSADGWHVSYVAVRGSGWYVVRDGEAYGPYEGLSRQIRPTWSPKGDHLVFAAVIDGVMRLVMDGRPESSHGVSAVPPAFSADGEHLAYVANDGPQHHWVVVDGVAGPACEDFPKGKEGSLALSADGSHVLYVAHRGGRANVYMDHSPGPPIDGWQYLTLGPNGRYAYTGHRGRKAFGVIDGEITPSYDVVGEFTYSVDGRLAYLVEEHRKKLFGFDRKVSVVLDGQVGAPHQLVWAAVRFSPDGRHLAYLAKDEDGARLYFDGNPQGRFDEVRFAPHFSPTGDRIAFCARTGKAWHVVCDRTPGPAFDETSPPIFASDGRLGYIGKAKGKEAVVIDHQAGPSFDQIGISSYTHRPELFASRSNYVGYVGRSGNQFAPVVDSEAGPTFEGLGPPDLDLVSGVAFWGGRGNTFFKVIAG